jgi:hypothetical protein
LQQLQRPENAFPAQAIRKFNGVLVDRVFINLAILHDHKEVLCRIFDQFDIRHWIAAFFYNAKLAWAPDCFTNDSAR